MNTIVAEHSMRTVGGRLSSEAELLLCCARARLDVAGAARIAELAAAGVDWDRLMALARQNGVLALLYQGLQAAANDLPQAVLARMQAEFQAHTQDSLRLAGELLRLAGALKAAGVPAIALKGPALAMLAYGNLALRSSVDLDILVRRADVARARDVLMAHGYQQHEQIGDRQIDAYLAAQHHFSFVHGGLLVELHYDLRERFFGYPIDVERMWADRAQVAIGRQAVAALSYQDQLVTLCVHGTAHCWERLIWICDIAELLRLGQAVDWECVLAELRSKGAERMLLLGVYVAHTLLGAPAPDLVIQRAAGDRAVCALAGQVAEWLFVVRDGAHSIPEMARFYLAVRERWGDRIRFCARLLCTPTLGDWSLVALPGRLAWLYYIMRPFRLAWAYGKAALDQRTG